MAIRTRLATLDDRAELIEFIRDHWSARHVFVSSPDVFDWQYVQPDGRINMVLAEDVPDDGPATVLGILGFIPMGRFDPALGDQDVLLAVWKVRDDIAPPGLGLRLLKAVQTQLKPRLIGAIGISDMVGPIYRALGYTLDHLTQAAVFNPDARGATRLAQGVPDAAFDECHPTSRTLRPLDPQADKAVVETLAARTCPQKSWNYVHDRYLAHPWYDYDCRIVSGDTAEAVIVWRMVEAQGARILRIVDVIGGDMRWLTEAAALLQPVLAETGAEYIDIMACGLSEDDMKAGGFISPSWCDGLILPNYFAPFEARNIPIALSWKRFDGNSAPILLFRADSDQDRPNQPTPRRVGHEERRT